jgi:hypothetical protein
LYVLVSEVPIVPFTLHEHDLFFITAFFEVLAINNYNLTWLSIIIHIGDPVVGQKRKVLVHVITVIWEDEVIVR